ncbi:MULTISPECIES: DUF4251 domain-containing protein [Flammeovirga]|uniref:DUF4251 domain-containing protein n=1 Tax=Flammeovirga agarivorans TaxID=2726742 RepID=A0A7X8SGP9_9BACT|nr:MULTISPECIES: DUF4251 domain-containing protein [Flammeovirga]NLR89921.1 DUF4251 domain-containing protein [Flammeovirga agarivorans]
MKNWILRSFTFFVLFSFIGLSNFATAQDTKPEQELTEKEKKKLARKKAKEERKKAKELAKQQAQAEEKARFEMAKAGMLSQQFVLQANQVYDRYGNTAQVTNNINFVKLDDDKCVVQLGFEGIVGYNGVGGITLDGKISDLKVEENDNGSIMMSFNVQGAMMQAAVRINLNGADNWADATVRSQTENIEIRFRGNILPTNLSSVYQGATPY